MRAPFFGVGYCNSMGTRRREKKGKRAPLGYQVSHGQKMKLLRLLGAQFRLHLDKPSAS